MKNVYNVVRLPESFTMMLAFSFGVQLNESLQRFVQ